MCDEDVGNCLAGLKFITGWFVTDKMIKKFPTALQADDNDNILYFNKNPRNAIFYFVMK